MGRRLQEKFCAPLRGGPGYPERGGTFPTFLLDRSGKPEFMRPQVACARTMTLARPSDVSQNTTT